MEIPDHGSLARPDAEVLVADSLARFGWEFESDARQFLVELAMLSRDELQIIHAMLKGAVEAAEAPPPETAPEAPPEAPPRSKLAGLARKRGSPRSPTG